MILIKTHVEIFRNKKRVIEFLRKEGKKKKKKKKEKKKTVPGTSVMRSKNCFLNR